MKKKIKWFLLMSVMCVFMLCGCSRKEKEVSGEDTTNTNFSLKSESELKVLAESYGIVSAWEYADYDGNGTKEAFAIITDEGLNILKTLFVSSNGEPIVMEDDLQWVLYTSDEGYIRYTGEKGFFWADMGAGGSGWISILYSVKENTPYKLQLSGRIQGFYKEGDVFYTTENEFLPECGHLYPNVELIYDSDLQEFTKGERIEFNNASGLFGGEGIFNTVITGQGHIWLQTMPIYSVAGAIRPYIPTGN